MQRGAFQAQIVSVFCLPNKQIEPNGMGRLVVTETIARCAVVFLRRINGRLFAWPCLDEYSSNNIILLKLS